MKNKILKELIKFCDINELSVLEFKLGTTIKKTSAKVLGCEGVKQIEFIGKWRYSK